jgi:hypothetical protein
MYDYETCLAFLCLVGIIAWLCVEVTFYDSKGRK